ncbi:MAG: PQQ-dependent sugar dehydrogenase [Acidobacteria bacterium]|nr:PQQ-dependent sugar dehydrogenase [Acidobacteriota bacterium]
MRLAGLFKLAALVLFAAFGVGVLFTNNLVNRRAYARSTGPDPAHTRAPGEDPEGCRVCHLVDGAPSGQVSISAPQSYEPGKVYFMAVAAANVAPTRLRWGFQLTAIDDDGNRAGTLQALDATTQVTTGALGSPARQYVSHTEAGTYPGQQNGAAWAFMWTAPATDVGVVTFYAAANQANNDGNSSGDSINFTFVAIQPAAQAADFSVTVTPPAQTILIGGSGSYTVTVTPANGFTGTVNLSLSDDSIAPGLDFSFSPASVQITDANPRASTLTFTPNSHAPLGSYNLTATATSGGVRRTARFTLATGPTVLDPGVGVRVVRSGLDQPIALAALGASDFLVLEKATGKVQRVTNGAPVSTALDLAVNSNSERGLLGIALHPRFPADPRVYLYWTESSTGADTANADEVPLLGNRVDSYLWNGSVLTHDRNLIRLRALQQDAGQPSRGNHDGGVLRFGPDGKLYTVTGDLGRRGLMQNLRFGPSVSSDGPAVADDQFGGPEPDNNHLSGVILRLNDDGTTPADNPFFNAATGLTGEAAANVRKVFAYGVRNSFGMDFDPVTGQLWTQENGDDSFDEINRVTPGFNGGWIQLMGPSSRVAQFKQIETERAGGLQQNRWPPERIAATPAEALARLYVLPGSQYREPEFSWKYAIAPAAVGFVRGGGLGPNTAGRLLVGASRTTLHGGYLFRLPLDAPRRGVFSAGAATDDRVADNLDKFDPTESQAFDFGRDFGVVTDIRGLANGNVLVVSLSHGAIYELFAKPAQVSFLSSPAALMVENGQGLSIVVGRSGDTSGTVSVDYRTVDNNQPVRCDDTTTAPGVAFARCDYVSVSGTLTFGPGETSKTFTVKSVTILGTPEQPGQPNPIDDNHFFVRQHYLDFLSRDPESGQPWTNILNNCPNVFNTDPHSASAGCDRLTVSGSFFRSPEFYHRGYFVYRYYKATLGRLPTYEEIIPDMARIGGATAQEVETRRAEFVNNWLLRPAAAAAYPATLSDAAFVDKLLLTAGVTLSAPDPVSGATRDSLVADLRAGNRTRAEVARVVVESREVDAKEFNGAFVAMQYFGYLRRDPEQPGYQNWLNYLNANPTDFRTMVGGFVNSQEYRLRFGPAQ